MMKFNLIILTFVFSGFAYAGNSASDEDIQAGSFIYNSNCSNICHQAPKAKRLKPKQWRIVLNTMQVRMQSVGMPKLTEQQLNQLFSYLQASR